MLKKIAIGLGLLVLIAVAVIYGKFFITRAVKDRAAVENVNKLHAAADIEGDELFGSRISRLQQLGILGEKVAASKADTCYINSAHGGFSISTWEQFCQLDYVAGYTAPLSQEETFDRIEAAPRHKDDPTFPRRLHPANRRGCRYSVWPENNITYLPVGSIPKGEGCHIPYLVNGITPRGARLPGTTSFDYTFNSDEIDRSVDLLWITYTHTYYREDLGCTPDPLCSSSPRSTPIQAD
jgi:hypothetical protein